MKTIQDFDTHQKLAQFGIQAVGNIVTVGVVIFLVLAWALTSPILHLIDRVADNGKVKARNK